ncbi:adenine deaminase [Bacillus sp. V5-8f]|uniref:adenine deaminase n=1 Tax=Bacillus sp. V5-8f TaxID=2053044 RepID=UPI000C788C45|nr:adenine deaminase [Bacillus sp. V5-8f]PLT33201.1 adenine deaminase [Bacillus sp. V5-8f]
MSTINYTTQIEAASKKIPADIVIKNGKIIDIFNLEIIEGDVAISGGMIVGIGDYNGHKIIDAKGRYISPSFIDSHVHIESSMVTPREFSKLVIPHGVTTVITDPHEIANVAGVKGIQFMLDDSEGLPLDVMVMLPSSVPATPFESSGAVLNAKDLKSFYEHPRVIGLAEVMDFPSVRDCSPEMLGKLMDASSQKAIIDGHAAGLDITGLNIYRTAGIMTDHESTTATDALERLKRGMYVLIREGSVARDLKALLPVVNERNARRCLFCTDDKHLDDILVEGSVDYNIRLAIEEGLDPLLAIQMASLNAAECYGLKGKGAIAPGYEADFLLLDDLKTVEIFQVYKNGELVAEEGEYKNILSQHDSIAEELTGSVHIPPLAREDLQITMKKHLANVIQIIPNSLTTNHLVESVDMNGETFIPSIEKDFLKLAVIERHHDTGNIGLGIVNGFRLTGGAIATTIAHDSHNLVVVGTNDDDMLQAIKELKKLDGGITVVRNKQTIASLSLPIGGLMTNDSFHQVDKSLKGLDLALQQIGAPNTFNPLLTLSFLTLPVIPKLKLTDKGLFNVETFEHITVEAFPMKITSSLGN